MTTVQVEGDTALPNGERLLFGIASDLSVKIGDSCELSVGETVTKITVTSVAMRNIDMVQKGLIGLLVRVQSSASISLVGCTLSFADPET